MKKEVSLKELIDDFKIVRGESEVHYYIIETSAGSMIKFDTPSHGYLVVPKVEDCEELLSIADGICKYGYKTNKAIYLEEDCEMTEFIKKVDIFKGKEEK